MPLDWQYTGPTAGAFLPWLDVGEGGYLSEGVMFRILLIGQQEWRLFMCGDAEYMREAIDEARAGIEHGHGGPFGAVVVRDGQIVGRGHNRVLLKHDPTCHAEMEAIRDACSNLGTHDLSGCTIYVTAEPCPMCLSACMWANINIVVYGCNRDDSEQIGFRDRAFYDCLAGKEARVHVREAGRDECLRLFAQYADMTDVRY